MNKIVFEDSQQKGERYITKQGAHAIIIIYQGQWGHRWKVFKFRMLLRLRRKPQRACDGSHIIVGVATHEQTPAGMKRCMK